MKKIVGLMLLALCVGCAGQTEGRLKCIDLEPFINDTTQIPASKLGKSIRYLPLQTADSATLIAANPVVRQWKDKIIVASKNNPIKIFDAKTGIFLNSVGEISRGPSGNSSPENFFIHPQTGNIYINSINSSNQKQVWDIEGNFLRKIEFPKIANKSSISKMIPQAIDDKGRFLVPIPVSCGVDDLRSLAIFSEGDSTAIRIIDQRDSQNLDFGDIISMTLMSNGATHRGSMSQFGEMILETMDMRYSEFGNDQMVWRCNDKIFFKQQYKDTVFQVIDTVVVPVLHFNMGKYAFDYNKRFDKDLPSDQFSSVTHVYQNDKVMLLEWSMGSHIGVYNLADGTIVAGRYKDGIRDDINNFLPLTIHTINDIGRFLAILDPLKIVEWNEAHPGQNSFLPQIDENSNIVIAIIE